MCTDKILTNHTAFEKKLFKYTHKPSSQTLKDLTLDGSIITSDLEDRNGLMQRDDISENELRIRVS